MAAERLDELLMDSARYVVRESSCKVRPSFTRESCSSFRSFRKALSLITSALAVFSHMHIASATLREKWSGGHVYVGGGGKREDNDTERREGERE